MGCWRREWGGPGPGRVVGLVRGGADGEPAAAKNTRRVVAPCMAHKAYYALKWGPIKSTGYAENCQSVLRFV